MIKQPCMSCFCWSQTMWMYEYFGYRDQVTLWIEQVRALTWEAIKTKAIDSVKDFLQLNKNRWTSWDVRRGEYGFQLYVPFNAMDLSFLQRLNLQRNLDYIRSAIARMIPDEDWSLIDTVYSYWPSRDIYNWIPPFKSKNTIPPVRSISVLFTISWRYIVVRPP